MGFSAKKAKFLPIIILFILMFSVAATALVFITATKADFDLGTYNNTSYSVPKSYVSLTGGRIMGTYTSKIFEVNHSHSWDNVTWIEGVPYGENLPNNGGVENVLGGANMSGNVLLLHLDETSGTASADTSGNSNNGVASSASWTAGRLGNGFSFNGLNNKITVPNSASLNPTNAFTIEMWVNANNLKKPSQTLISKWEPGSGSFNQNASNSWEAMVMNDTLNPSFKGYGTAVFDGRYVYFVPRSTSGEAAGGNVVRYDTTGSFTNNASNSWQSFNTETLNSNFKSYWGGAFDGRYVYLIEYNTIVRYDTTGSFTANATDTSSGTSSWQAIKPSSLNSAFAGYSAGVFDGRYMYFVPYGGGTNANALRYDTTGNFTHNVSNSWEVLNTNSLNPPAMGHWGGAFDGRYVYFVPFWNGTFHGKVVRYDTTGSFTQNISNSWQVMDMATLNQEFRGYMGAVFDGKYVYFVPNEKIGSFHGNVVRYDTTGSFAANATDTITGHPSWQTMNMSLVNAVYSLVQYPQYAGYSGAIFDGRYIYFVPQEHTTERHGNVMRYDTQGNFTHNTNGSWQVMNVESMNSNYLSYLGGTFDGRHVYLVPFGTPDGTDDGGSVLRYDSGGANSSYALLLSSQSEQGFSNSAAGLTAKFATSTGAVSLSTNTQLTAGWHHVAATYDGVNLTLYLDGTLKNSKNASGTVQASTADLIIGAENSASLFNGTVDELAIYNRALSLAEIQKHYERGVANLNLTVRTSNNSVNWTEFRGVGNSTTAFGNSQLASLAGFDNFNYLQYKFNFETIVAGERPSLHNVTISYTNTSVAATGGGGEAPLSSGGGGSGSVSSSPTPATKTETTATTSTETTTAPQTYDIAIPSAGETQTYTASVTSVTETTATVEFGSGAASPAVTLGIGQSSYVDLNGDNIVDVQVTLNGITNGVPDLTFEVLPTETKGASETGTEKIENTPTGFLTFGKTSTFAAIIMAALVISGLIVAFVYRKFSQQ